MQIGNIHIPIPEPVAWVLFMFLQLFITLKAGLRWLANHLVYEESSVAHRLAPYIFLGLSMFGVTQLVTRASIPHEYDKGVLLLVFPLLALLFIIPGKSKVRDMVWYVLTIVITTPLGFLWPRGVLPYDADVIAFAFLYWAIMEGVDWLARGVMYPPQHKGMMNPRPE